LQGLKVYLVVKTTRGHKILWIVRTRKRFFFGKKEAKNFCILQAFAPVGPEPAGAKVFLLLFFKKEALAFFVGLNRLVAFPASLRWTGGVGSPICAGMNDKLADRKVRLGQLGGWRGLLRAPGLVLHTLRAGAHVGTDAVGNQYYEERRTADGRRARRWVVYKGPVESSTVTPEWHSWLHYVTDEPLPDTGRLPWQKPHRPNLTGTVSGYRPAGHDYAGGNRAKTPADYEAWTPDS
jgi:NADH:ubiquinone oxidoreductase subunit